MHTYFTFGWALLSEDQRGALCYDATDYTEFDWHAYMRRYNGDPLEPPPWAIEMADNEIDDVTRVGAVA
jgi:hypothetical protein